MDGIHWIYLCSTKVDVKNTHKDLNTLQFKIFFFRYWTVALPVYILVGIALAIVGYVGATLLLVPAPDSIHTLTGIHKRHGT